MSQGKKKGLLIFILLGCVLWGLFFYQTHRRSLPRIVLDAGHDSTMKGYQGYLAEEEYTDQFVNQLYTELENTKQYEVLKTHSSQEEKSVLSRASFIQEKKPDLVLSIHAQWSPNPNQFGYEVFVMPVSKRNHESSVSFAQLLQETYLEKERPFWIGTLYYIPIEEGIYQIQKVPLDQEEHDEETIELMNLIEEVVVEINPIYVSSLEDVESYGREEGIQQDVLHLVEAIDSYFENTMQE